MPKLSHDAVNYGPGHKTGDHCAICEHYRKKPGNKPSCAIVVPPIEPLGWCKKFKKAASAAAKRLMRRGLVSAAAYDKACR